MGFATARPLDPEAIPVIDISGLRDGSDALRVAKALHGASQGLGFIYVRGHGIADELIDPMRRAAMDFFHLPESEKAAVAISDRHRGWLRPGGAKMQDNAKVDLKESFLWGHQDALGRTPEDHPLRGANRWPTAQPALEPLAMRYFAAAHEVAHYLMRAFALGLGLDEEFFLQTIDRPLSRASAVYYPPQPPELGSEQFGVGPHTDFGTLTVLCQDDVGGLQVQDVRGEWIEAPPIPGTLLVNVGDLLSRWTDGAYVSTPHRVVNASGRERLSLVLAYDPNPETVIDSRSIFGDRPDAPEPISCGDYLIWRFEKAFAYRKAAGTQRG